MGLRVALLALPLSLACASGPVEPREAGREHAAIEQHPIESACTTDARPIADFGLVMKTEFSGDSQAKLLLENASSSPHRVSPSRVALCRGPCSGAWTRCSDYRKFDRRERARYDVVLDPGESIELLVDARLSEQQTRCEKAGLFLILGVDDKTACTDAGSWIALERSE